MHTPPKNDNLHGLQSELTWYPFVPCYTGPVAKIHNNIQTDVMVMDLAKSFDIVDSLKSLLYKLQYYCTDNNTLELIGNFLLTVMFNRYRENWSNI